MEMRSQHQRFIDAVEKYDRIWVAREDELDGIIRVEWDERADSARQITELQRKVNSTAPIHEGINVHMADITTQQVIFNSK